MNSYSNKKIEYITAESLSALLNISLSKVYFLCREKKIPYYQIGSQKRFNSDEISKWIANNYKGLGGH